MNKLWHTCTNKAQQRVLTWSSIFFLNWHSPPSRSLRLVSDTCTIYRSPPMLPANMVVVCVLKPLWSNSFISWPVSRICWFFEKYTFNKYCKKSNLNHNSNTRPVTYQANALTAELTRPDELNVAHLLIRWQTKSSYHLHNSNCHCLN